MSRLGRDEGLSVGDCLSAAEAVGRTGSHFRIVDLILYASDEVHLVFSFRSSLSALPSSSRNSKTRRSWAAIATMKSLGSTGDAIPDPIDSVGVGGIEFGVGLDGRLFAGATGSVRERRLALREEAVELERVDRVSHVSLGVETGVAELVHGWSVNPDWLSLVISSLLPVRAGVIGAVGSS